MKNKIFEIILSLAIVVAIIHYLPIHGANDFGDWVALLGCVSGGVTEFRIIRANKDVVKYLTIGNLIGMCILFVVIIL
jgi:hypothetical protein